MPNFESSYVIKDPPKVNIEQLIQTLRIVHLNDVINSLDLYVLVRADLVHECVNSFFVISPYGIEALCSLGFLRRSPV